MQMCVKFIVSICPSQSAFWKPTMIAEKGKYKMCLFQKRKVRKIVKCIVTDTKKLIIWEKPKLAPLPDYMKNPLWDIPPLVKPKTEPVLAYRKTSLGENTSLSQNTNQYYS